jgi:hypothetical protein
VVARADLKTNHDEMERLYRRLAELDDHRRPGFRNRG